MLFNFFKFINCQLYYYNITFPAPSSVYGTLICVHLYCITIIIYKCSTSFLLLLPILIYK